MVRTQISLTDEQAEALRRLSLLRRRSQAALLRDAVDQVVGADEQARRVARARACVGAFRSGERDVSVNHDDALDDAFAR